MKIPLPYNFGEDIMYLGQWRTFRGVDWFKWSDGWRFTYYLSKRAGKYIEFDQTAFCSYTERQAKDFPNYFVMPDGLLFDKPIAGHGFPLRGTGKALGLSYIDEETFIDFIITSDYNEHIRVQCNENGRYVKDGKILFPPSWDTQKKKDRMILKTFKSNGTG